MEHNIKPVLEVPSCGKADRCKYDADCPYNWQPVLSGLCFERKPEVKKSRKHRKDIENGKKD